MSDPAGDESFGRLFAISMLSMLLVVSIFSGSSATVTCAFGFFVTRIGTASDTCGTSDLTALGQWLNMPSGSRCGFGNTTAPACELLGNSTHRGLLSPIGAVASGLCAGLAVGCINPSNTPGASLQLQYANYSTTTHVNVSRFVNIGTALLIDNSVNNPCPGILTASSGMLPAISDTQPVYEFRVVGYGGGGSGDNPRFSRVDVYTIQTLVSVVIGIARSITTTGFQAWLWGTKSVSLSTIRNFIWIATSLGVSLESGTGTCTVAAGQFQCNVAVSFSPAYTSAPQVTVEDTDQASVIQVPSATITLLLAQTLTV